MAVAEVAWLVLLAEEVEKHCLSGVEFRLAEEEGVVAERQYLLSPVVPVVVVPE